MGIVGRGKIIVLATVAAAVLGGLGLMIYQNLAPTKQPETSSSAPRETVPDEEQAGIEDGQVSFSGKVLAGDSSPLLEYNKDDYQKALESDRLVVLYFYANWCPICKREVANALFPTFDGLSGDDVVGFRIHFNDSEVTPGQEELAREYGIAYQHTKVFIKNKQRALKSPEEWTRERYVSEIAKYR